MPSKRARPEPAPAAPQEPVSDCRYPDAKRRNIPPAGLAAQGQVREVPRHTFAYNPHLPPVLRFDAGGQSDSLPALLQTARERALTADEARLLSEALRVREPWLEWSGKREAKACEVDPVALHIHERVSAQAILRVAARQDIPRTLFADPEQEYREAVQFYRHDVDWANRLILGDSLAVMASLAKREDLAGKVAMIYMDPPYGIRFASNFQSEIGKRDVKDKAEDLTREPEMVKAYRDTWTLGVHSYLAYLRDRLYAARDLLADTGSIFVQISDDNVHRVRQILDEVFGASNFVSEIVFRKAGNAATGTLATVADYILWYAKRREAMHYRQIYLPRASSEGIPASFALCEEESGHIRAYRGAEDAAMPFQSVAMEAAGIRSGDLNEPFVFQERTFSPRGGAHWKTPHANLRRLAQVGRLLPAGDRLRYKMFLSDYQVTPLASF